MTLDARRASDMRRIALHWMFERPLTWRTRRTDVFEGISDDAATQTTHVDIRIRHADFHDILCRLVSAYEQKGQTWDARVVEGSKRQSAGGSGSSEASDLLVPIVWLGGPPMNLEVLHEGRQVVPLSRWETADVMGGFFAALVRDAEQKGELSVPTVPLTFLGWMLVAADAYSLRVRKELSGLTGHLASTENVEAIADWVLDTSASAGLDSADLQRAYVEDRIGRVQMRAAQVLERWKLRARAEGFAFDGHWLFNPATNPSLLYYSFVKLHWWENEQSNPSENPAVDGRLLFDRFIFIAGGLLDLVDSALVRQDAAARYLLRLVEKLALSWPVLVRADVMHGRTTRFTVSQVIPMLASRSEQDVPDRSATFGFGWSVLRWFERLSRLASRVVVQGVFWLTDSVRLSRRRTQVGTQAYPLALFDSTTYHVEVRASGSELKLVPGATFIKLPERDFGHPKWRRAFEGAAARQFFPYSHAVPSVVFGRASDDGTLLHHFYTTKTKRAVTPPEREAEIGGPPLLVSRFYVASPIAAINWLLAASLLMLSLLIARASMLSLPGVDPQGAGAIDFPEFAKAAVPWYLAVMLLFAFEKHSDHRVSSRLRWPATLVVVSFVIFLIAVLERTLGLDRDAFFMIPESIETNFTIPWIRAAKALTGHLREYLDQAVLVAKYMLGALSVLAAPPILLVLSSRWARAYRSWATR